MPEPVVRGLYAIADTLYLPEERLASAVEEAITGGARVIQYRDKGHDRARRHRQALILLAVCRARGVPLIVNDDVELAAAIDADGVHVGRDDAAIAAACAQFGANRIIGVSCYNELERARAAESAGASYVAFGRFFPSRSKPQAVSAPIELLSRARAELRVPIVAIGGITPENGGSLIEAGADALAVIEGVFNQTDVRAAARRYARLFENPA